MSNLPDFLKHKEQFQTIYGRNLLAEISNIIPKRSLIVTMEDLWDKWKGHFNHLDAQVHFANSMEVINLDEAINIFEKFLPEDEDIDLRKSLKVSAKYFGTELEWGIMDSDVVEKFLKWLRTEGLELQEFGVHDIISNELLQLKF